MDESDIEGKIEAARYNPTMNKTLHQHLRTETQYNVFIAEVITLKSAAEITQESHPYAGCHIHTDSQPAIKAIDNPRQQSGQAVIQDFLDCIDDSVKQHPELQFTIMMEMNEWMQKLRKQY